MSADAEFKAIEGVLLGTAVGDALGLPREGMSPQRAARMFGAAPLEHRLIFGRGLISDDTEHTCMTAQALLVAPNDSPRFARSLAWKFRWWLAGVPAGIGLATLRSILRLWLGYSPERSGVFSAGNGPAMRAAILGVFAGEDSPRLKALVRSATRLTHVDPKAEQGAWATAHAAAHGARRGGEGLEPAVILSEIQEQVSDAEFLRALDLATVHLARQASAGEYAAALKLKRGISGYVNHTVPVALYCWLRWPRDFRRAVEEVILLGGDSDTTAAIVGGLSGATLGAASIPAGWLTHLCEWPRSVAWMRRLARRLAEQKAAPSASIGPEPLFWPGVLLRNLGFTAIVLTHGLRRLLPPY